MASDVSRKVRISGNLVYCYQHGEVSQPHPIWLSDQHRPPKEQILGLVIIRSKWTNSRPGLRRPTGADRRLSLFAIVKHSNRVFRPSNRKRSENVVNRTEKESCSSAIEGKLFNHVTVWDLDWLNPSLDLLPSNYQRIRQKTLRCISQLEYVSKEGSTGQMLGSRSFPVS